MRITEQCYSLCRVTAHSPQGCPHLMKLTKQSAIDVWSGRAGTKALVSLMVTKKTTKIGYSSDLTG